MPSNGIAYDQVFKMAAMQISQKCACVYRRLTGNLYSVGFEVALHITRPMFDYLKYSTCIYFRSSLPPVECLLS